MQSRLASGRSKAQPAVQERAAAAAEAVEAVSSVEPVEEVRVEDLSDAELAEVLYQSDDELMEDASPAGEAPMSVSAGSSATCVRDLVFVTSEVRPAAAAGTAALPVCAPLEACGGDGAAAQRFALPAWGWHATALHCLSAELFWNASRGQCSPASLTAAAAMPAADTGNADGI